MARASVAMTAPNRATTAFDSPSGERSRCNPSAVGAGPPGISPCGGEGYSAVQRTHRPVADAAGL
ncbi:hypothetical protein GCM10020227_45460 [Streptomyces flavovirens]